MPTCASTVGRLAGERDVAQVELELADAELVLALQLGRLQRAVVAIADAAAQRHVDACSRPRSPRASTSPTRISVCARPTNAAATSAAPTTHVADREHDGEVHVERAGRLQQARDARADQQHAERERREERARPPRAALARGTRAQRARRRRRGPRRGLRPRARRDRGRLGRRSVGGAVPAGVVASAVDGRLGVGRRRAVGSCAVGRRSCGAGGGRRASVRRRRRSSSPRPAQHEDREAAADQQQRRAEVIEAEAVREQRGCSRSTTPIADEHETDEHPGVARRGRAASTGPSPGGIAIHATTYAGTPIHSDAGDDPQHAHERDVEAVGLGDAGRDAAEHPVARGRGAGDGARRRGAAAEAGGGGGGGGGAAGGAFVSMARSVRPRGAGRLSGMTLSPTPDVAGRRSARSSASGRTPRCSVAATSRGPSRAAWSRASRPGSADAFGLDPNVVRCGFVVLVDRERPRRAPLRRRRGR